MKLLCWMHRKFRQNTNEALKALVIGQSSLDYGARAFKQGQREHRERKSFTGMETTRAEEEEYEEESSAAISELFHGFLAIGTLGSEQMMADPATPTFAISVENITEKDQTEVTDNELKLINEELEKVLGAEAPEESSGRNSHVSNGRSSHGSAITLSGRAEEGPGGANPPVCPLQGYLFGSAIELSETTATAKKEHRTSLGELFQRTKITDDAGGGKSERPEKEAEKSAMNIMKKRLKKKMLHASSRSSSSGSGSGTGSGSGSGQPDSAPAEKKLHKILHMFHRKVHPESSAGEMKSAKPQKKKKSSHDGSCNYEGQIPPDNDDDIMLCPQRALFLKQKIRRYRSQSNPPQFTFTSIDSSGNREQWIKTDADYLVLEL